MIFSILSKDAFFRWKERENACTLVISPIISRSTGGFEAVTLEISGDDSQCSVHKDCTREIIGLATK